MKPMVRSRSTVMRSVRETPGRRLSFISISLVVSAPRRRATAWLVSDGAILSVNPQIYSKLPYDPKDIAPVAYLAVAPLFLAVHPKVPVATLQQFVDYAKSQPGMLNYGSSGVGSIHHISMEALKA